MNGVSYFPTLKSFDKKTKRKFFFVVLTEKRPKRSLIGGNELILEVFLAFLNTSVFIFGRNFILIKLNLVFAKARK